MSSAQQEVSPVRELIEFFSTHPEAGRYLLVLLRKAPAQLTPGDKELLRVLYRDYSPRAYEVDRRFVSSRLPGDVAKWLVAESRYDIPGVDTPPGVTIRDILKEPRRAWRAEERAIEVVREESQGRGRRYLVIARGGRRLVLDVRGLRMLGLATGSRVSKEVAPAMFRASGGDLSHAASTTLHRLFFALLMSAGSIKGFKVARGWDEHGSRKRAWLLVAETESGLDVPLLVLSSYDEKRYVFGLAMPLGPDAADPMWSVPAKMQDTFVNLVERLFRKLRMSTFVKPQWGVVLVPRERVEKLGGPEGFMKRVLKAIESDRALRNMVTQWFRFIKKDMLLGGSRDLVATILGLKPWQVTRERVAQRIIELARKSLERGSE